MPRPAAALGGEHARGDRVAETERRADRHDPFADARGVRVGELGGREAGRVDLDDGEIGRRVAPDEARRQVAPVAQAHVDREGLLDDVVVREDRAVRREDDARAHAPRDRLVAPVAPEEVREQIGLLVARRHVDLHDARARVIGDRDEPLGEALGLRGRRLDLRGRRDRSVARARRGSGVACASAGDVIPPTASASASDAAARTKELIGRSYFPSCSRAGVRARPPFKPCMRISRTRLTGDLSCRSITQPPGIGRCHAGDGVRGCGSSRATSFPPRPLVGSGPCASHEAFGAGATRTCRVG